MESSSVSRTLFCVLRGLGQRLNKQKPLISTFTEMRGFRICITDALLATISLTPKQLEKSVLLSGSDLSYNERTIGLTVHCKSFHARTANCEAARVSVLRLRSESRAAY